ncbi:MAG: DNA-processing protein DprA [Candidatus Hydrogenedentes bacterium]|nr:DNA-processing protein DprA [Candidatus Hydrogenedentota bacterium]
MNAWNTSLHDVYSNKRDKKADADIMLRGLGDQRILGSTWTAFFSSVRCPGNLILSAYDLAQRWRLENRPVVSGFHSPVEREVLNIMLRSQTPVCIVLARSIPTRVPKELRDAIDGGRLLVLSPFGATTKRATQETASRRNEVVAAIADRIVVVYAASGSKTEAFCRQLAGSGKTCLTFDDPKTENLKAAGFDPFLD